MRGSRGDVTRRAALEPRRCAVAGIGRVELLPRAPYQAAYTPGAPIIGFAFDGQVGIHAFASDRKTGFRAKPNGLAYLPAGCEVYSQSNDGGEYLRITVDGGHSGPGARRFSDVIDPIAIDAAERLRRRLLADDDGDPLPCERLVHALVERVECVLRGVAVMPPAASWMTPHRLRRVDDLIDAKLEGHVTVQDLADALGLSVGFFYRAFKAATGKAPHRYIVDRRMSRARALLPIVDLDLSAIAQAAGFASHAHMTTAFRHRLGVTPSAMRRLIR